jgi:hypothetical protein
VESSKATTVAEYLVSLPADRRAAVETVREVVNRSLPPGFVESMQYGMIGWGVPLSVFPDTYNGQPAGIACIASQKNYLSLYLLGVYSSEAEAMAFRDEYAKSGKKLDMGQSCVRFKKAEDLALDVIGRALARVTPDELIARHRAAHSKDAVAKRRAERSTTKAATKAKPKPAPKAKAKPAAKARPAAEAKAKARPAPKARPAKRR